MLSQLVRVTNYKRRGKTINKAIICLLYFSIFCGLPIAEPPNWFISGKTKFVTQKSHLIGLGSGESHAVATDKALADMIKHIEVSIKSESSNYLSSFLDKDVESIKSKYNSTINSVTEGGVKGAETIEKSMDGNTHYVMLAIQRKVYLEQLDSKMKTYREAIAKMRMDGNELLDQGKMISGLGLIMETIDFTSEIATREALYHAISGSAYPASGLPGGQEIISEIRRMLGRLKLQKLSGDNQSAKRGYPLTDPLLVKAYFLSDTETEIPLSNVKFKLQDKTGKLSNTRICDEDGIVSFRISAFGKKQGQVSIGVNLIGLHPVFQQDLRNILVTFDYDVENTVTLPVSINITDENGAPVNLVAHKVSSAMQEMGHVVLNEAPLMLKGIVRLEDYREIDGLRGIQYMVSVSLNLELIMSAEGKSIGSLQFTSNGIHKASKDHAVETAYRKMSVPEIKLAELIASNSSELIDFLDEFSTKAFEHGKKMFSAGKYVEAISSLSQVTFDKTRVRESKKIIAKIQADPSQ